MIWKDENSQSPKGAKHDDTKPIYTPLILMLTFFEKWIIFQKVFFWKTISFSYVS